MPAPEEGEAQQVDREGEEEEQATPPTDGDEQLNRETLLSVLLRFTLIEEAQSGVDFTEVEEGEVEEGDV